MKKRIGRCFAVLVLCFSCILLFKSVNAWARDDVYEQKYAAEAGEPKEIGDFCQKQSEMRLKIYLDGEAYITIDIAFLAVVLMMLLLLVVNRQS